MLLFRDNRFLLGCGIFFLYFILSITFYKERVIYADTSYLLFNIINSGTFEIAHARLTEVFSQWLPVIGIHLGISLKGLILLYSISFPIFYFLIYLLTTVPLKQPGIALLIPFSLVFGNTITFFYPVTDLQMGLAICTITLALSRVNLSNASPLRVAMNLGGMILSIELALVSHIVTVFPIICILLLNLFTNKSKFTKIIWAISIFLILLRIGQTASNEYENKILDNLIHGFFNPLELIKSPIFIYLLNLSIKAYLLPMVLFSYSLYRLLKEKRSIEFLVILSSILIFLVFNIFSYLNGESETMLEKSFLPLSFFFAIPLVIRINEKSKFLKIENYLIFLGLLIGFTTFITKSKNFSKRLKYIESFFENSSHSKLILPSENTDWEIIGIPWAVPFESLLLSSLKGNSNSKTLVIEYNGIQDYKTHELPDLFLGPDFYPTYLANNFNKKYFNLPDSKYKRLNSILKK